MPFGMCGVKMCFIRIYGLFRILLTRISYHEYFGGHFEEVGRYLWILGIFKHV